MKKNKMFCSSFLITKLINDKRIENKKIEWNLLPIVFRF